MILPRKPVLPVGPRQALEGESGAGQFFSPITNVLATASQSVLLHVIFYVLAITVGILILKIDLHLRHYWRAALATFGIVGWLLSAYIDLTQFRATLKSDLSETHVQDVPRQKVPNKGRALWPRVHGKHTDRNNG